MNAKKVVLGIGIGCFGLVLLVGVGGYLFLRSAFSPESGRREAARLGAPRVVTGAGLLSPSPFLSAPSLGSVTDIKLGKVDPNPDVIAAVAGEEGAVFIKGDGTAVSSVSLPDRYEHVDAVDVEGDGSCEFLNRGSWGSDPALLAHDGRLLWTYQAPDGADDTAPGDINRDGKLEFALGCNGGGGVHLIAPDGRRLWQQPDANVWHVEMADVDGTGALKILHSNAGGELSIRDGAGNVVQRMHLPPIYLSHFAVAPWPSPPQAIIAPGTGIIGIYDGSGKPRTTLQAPEADNLADVWATPVAFQAGSPAYLAVTLDFRRAGRSLLYVYDSTGSLVYQEVLPESCHALAPLPLGTGGEALLVGGNGTVTKYTWASAAP